MKKLNDLLERANFTELSPEIVIDKFLLHEDSLSSTNLQIRIDGYDYDVLKFWIMGREQMSIEESSSLKKFFFRKSSQTTMDYFKRVVVAVRLKGHDRLYLKAFRDIPLQSLTKLLPAGKLQLGEMERKCLLAATILGSTTTGLNLILNMADYHVPGLFVGGTSLSLAMILGSLRSYHRSKTNYLSSMNQMTFYKNIASNKQLLSMIVDRAQDELSKEVSVFRSIIMQRNEILVVLVCWFTCSSNGNENRISN